MTIDAPDKILDVNEFYILLVEDDPDLYFELLQNRVAKCLDIYQIPRSNIRWTVARNTLDALAALAEMKRREPHGRGFDAILCDLEIPASPNEVLGDVSNGLEVAKTARTYGWLTAIICLSQFSEADHVLAKKREGFDALMNSQMNDRVFDEFLAKDKSLGLGSVGEVKLRRWLIPTAHFVARARRLWTPPAYFGRSTWNVFRSLIQIASLDVAGWPLPKILLLGESGSGKTCFARTYFALLREIDSLRGNQRPRSGDRPYVVNCASLVAEGEGGRVRLFGFRSRGTTIQRTPGVFEMATMYGRPKVDGFAPENAEPDYEAGGVVFLDEFVAMDKDLQAAVLNTLEEGIVHRQDGSEVPIGCHVIFATNASVDDLTETVRGDLLDRIPYVLTIPPLRSRIDEIDDLIKFFALDRLRRYKETKGERLPASLDIQITQSAKQIIEQAVGRQLITSVRQLQTIATVLDDETEISDGNLSWLVEKARLWNRPLRAEKGKEPSLAEKAKDLGLPPELHQVSLPAPTKQAIDFLYELDQGRWKKPNSAFPRSEEGKEAKRRFYFLLIFIRAATRLTGQSPDAIRAERFRLARGLDIDTRDEAEVVAYLTNKSTTNAKKS